MTDRGATLERRMLDGDLDWVPEQALIEFVSRQRWFGGKAKEIIHVRVLETAPIRSEPPVLVDALVEVRFGAGTHELYQLLLSVGADGSPAEAEVVARVDGHAALEALSDPEHVQALVALMRSSATLPAGEGELVFRNTAGAHVYGSEAPVVRPYLGEQSNSSFILDERLMLKAYRRLEPGINPELELLRFLTARGFPNVPALVGWFAYSGPLVEATLGVLQRYVTDARDGWSVALELLERGRGEEFLPLAERLGEVTGDMHAMLASDHVDPAFAPEEPSPEAMAILSARIDEEVTELFATLPDLPVLAPIADCAEVVRERLRHLPAVYGGRTIRHHGDYHLGQVLWTGRDWVVIDFEGEPGRHLTERRRKRSPLRDVAGMVRSFAYVEAAFEQMQRGPVDPGWHDEVRDAFLGAYFPRADAGGLMPDRRAADELLALFELEKSVYELRYELGHRPDWVGIAVAGIAELLERA
jgi:maltokinase